MDVLDSTDKDATLQDELNSVALTLVHFFEVSLSLSLSLSLSTRLDIQPLHPGQ